MILKPHYNLSGIPSTLLTPQDADAFDQICFSGYSAAELAKSGEYQNKVSTNPSGGLFQNFGTFLKKMIRCVKSVIL